VGVGGVLVQASFKVGDALPEGLDLGAEDLDISLDLDGQPIPNVQGQVRGWRLRAF
jgi:hypothetical protein